MRGFKRGYARIHMLKQNFNNENEKTAGSKGAISVIVALSALAIILTIGLSASYAATSELSISGDAGKSVKAFYAAETGIEQVMYSVAKRNEPVATLSCASGSCAGSGTGSSVSIGDASYIIYATGCLCDNSISKIQSVGEYLNISRSIEISF